MVKAFIGLGCNVGDCALTFRKALAGLSEQPGVSVVRVSSIQSTRPIGPVQDQPDFLNAVAEIETILEPLALLDCLKEMEVNLGRVHREKWGPREIDLDILTFGDIRMDHPRLTLPHPETRNRPFLCELIREIQASHDSDVTAGSHSGAPVTNNSNSMGHGHDHDSTGRTAVRPCSKTQ